MQSFDGSLTVEEVSKVESAASLVGAGGGVAPRLESNQIVCMSNRTASLILRRLLATRSNVRDGSDWSGDLSSRGRHLGCAAPADSGKSEFSNVRRFKKRSVDWSTPSTFSNTIMERA